MMPSCTMSQDDIAQNRSNPALIDGVEPVRRNKTWKVRNDLAGLAAPVQLEVNAGFSASCSAM